MRSIRPLLFRIFYSTSFTIVFLLVIGFTVITPADAVRQAWNDGRGWDIGILAGAYVVTGSVAVLIYSSRLYTTRSILQSIPKAYIPIEKEDLPGRLVRKEISEGLNASALIAYKARPRFERNEGTSVQEGEKSPIFEQSDSVEEQPWPTWSHIAHPGWSSPASPDIPSLRFDTVVAELANLIEAKAVSLAPAAPTFPGPTTIEDSPVPDQRAVAMLQRPLNMGMRDYISYLSTLDLINPSTLAPDFLTIYELARFSPCPLDEAGFRRLMGIFALILRGMTRFNQDFLAALDSDSPPAHADGTNTGCPSTGQSAWHTPETYSARSRASSFSADETGSTRHHHHGFRTDGGSGPYQPYHMSRESVSSIRTLATEDYGGDEYAPSLHTAPLPQSQAHAPSIGDSSSASIPNSSSDSIASSRISRNRRSRIRQRTTFSPSIMPLATSLFRRSSQQLPPNMAFATSDPSITSSTGSVLRS